MSLATRLVGLSLTEWSKRNPVPANMLWKGAVQGQLDRFNRLLTTAHRFDKDSVLSVVGSHRSKSIDLPIVILSLPNVGLDIWIRDNFHNIAVTVEAPTGIKALDVSEMDVSSLNDCYFEGFTRSNAPVHGPYTQNHSQFSFHYWGGDFDSILERLATALSGQRDNLTEWSKKNPVPAQMYWKESAQHQLAGFQTLHATALQFDKDSILDVVGDHISKSIKLPVISISLPNVGLKIWIRNNFFNTAVTVEAQRGIKDLDVSEMDVSSLNDCYFEGFTRSNAPVHGPYTQNHSQFSFHYWGEEFATIFNRLVGTAILSGK